MRGARRKPPGGGPRGRTAMAQIVNDPRAVLGLEPNATADEVRRAYRRLARESHPDVNPDAAAGERFQAIKAAHDALLSTAEAIARTRKPRRKRAARGLGSAFQRGPVY